MTEEYSVVNTLTMFQDVFTFIYSRSQFSHSVYMHVAINFAKTSRDRSDANENRKPPALSPLVTAFSLQQKDETGVCKFFIA